MNQPTTKPQFNKPPTNQPTGHMKPNNPQQPQQPKPGNKPNPMNPNNPHKNQPKP